MKRFAKFNEQIKPEYEKKYKPTVTDAININKSLYDTFVKLDSELINKKKERNQALVELKDNIGAVANQIQQVSDGLKQAAENYNSFKDAQRELDNARAQQTNDTIINNTNNNTTTAGNKTTTNT
jgi:Na+/phosphate symporter